MVGYIRCTHEKGQASVAVKNLYGVKLVCAVLYIPDRARPKAVERRLMGIVRVFQRSSVSRVILPKDFPYRERLRCFKEIDGLNFYRAVADVLALGWLEAHGLMAAQSCVTLAGTRLCPELEYTARHLCCDVRRICIEVPGGEAELFAAELQREFGVPVTPCGIPSDLTVEFGPTEKSGQLRLWGEQPYLDGLQLRAEGIELSEELQLPILTLLWEMGYLRRQQLQIFMSKTEKSC